MLYTRVRENRQSRERLSDACESLHSIDEDFSVNGMRIRNVVMPLTPVNSLYELCMLVYQNIHDHSAYSLLLGMQVGVFMIGYGTRDSF